MRRKSWLKVVALAVVAGLVGCAPSQVYISNQFTSARKVAVLPMVNESNDLDGPIFVRNLIHNQLESRGFQVLPINQVDAQLKENGFSDGGQLKAAKAQDLGQYTGADTLFYSALEDFNYINVGFYWQRHVKISAKLVDVKTGERLWEAERDWATREVVANTEQAKRQFAVQLAVKAVEKLAHVPLQAESRVAVNRLLNTLPSRL